jgi:predicted amidophosphoribosyltransferase
VNIHLIAIFKEYPYSYSQTNQPIANFKKKLNSSSNELQYKKDAIKEIGRQFTVMIDCQKLKDSEFLLIPIPPSKERSDPLYDPRMMQVLEHMRNITKVDLDIRDCLSFSGSISASHESDYRATQDELYNDLMCNLEELRANERPRGIILFDDMLTNGTHFMAVRQRLRKVFGDIYIAGIFVCRRLP